jgi:amino acid transporter
MNYKKYKLPTGLAGALSLFFIVFFRYASPSSNMIVVIILFVLITIMFIGLIIGRKKIKSKPNNEYNKILPFGICLFVIGLMMIADKIFNNFKIDDKLIVVFAPILLIIFGKIASDYQISQLKNKKEIERTKRNTTLSIAMLSILEVVALYGAFIYKK